MRRLSKIRRDSLDAHGSNQSIHSSLMMMFTQPVGMDSSRVYLASSRRRSRRRSAEVLAYRCIRLAPIRYPNSSAPSRHSPRATRTPRPAARRPQAAAWGRAQPPTSRARWSSSGRAACPAAPVAASPHPIAAPAASPPPQGTTVCVRWLSHASLAAELGH